MQKNNQPMFRKILAYSLIPFAAMLWTAPGNAQEAEAPAEEPLPPLEPEAPPPPPPVQSGEVLEPEVTIIREGKKVVEEYRINGELYLIKVTPAVGPAYYLMDADGDGRLETRSHELDPGILVPSWVLFRW